MSYDEALDKYNALSAAGIPTADTYQERWPDDWERRYRQDVLTWRRRLVIAMDKRLCALEARPAGDDQIATLRQRLAEEHDKRQAAEGKLEETQGLVEYYERYAHAFDETGEIIAHLAEEFATILKGDARVTRGEA